MNVKGCQSFTSSQSFRVELQETGLSSVFLEDISSRKKSSSLLTQLAQLSKTSYIAIPTNEALCVDGDDGTIIHNSVIFIIFYFILSKGKKLHSVYLE